MADLAAPARPRVAAALPRAGARYSRFVALMKIVLPLIAAVLVLAVAAWPQFRDVREGFRIELARLTQPSAGGQRMSSARFTGIDARNRPFTVTAEAAAQDDERPDAIRLARPKADITLADGAWVIASAETGSYLRNDELLWLSGGVNLFHDKGFEIASQSATIDLRAGTARGEEPVEGHGPSASLSAAGFIVLDGGQRILFSGKSRLVLRPDTGQTQ